MERKKQSKVCVHLLEKEKPYYFSPEQQKSTADSFFQNSLKLAWDNQNYIATCCCEQAQELKLYIRSNKGSGPFTLCRNPNTGPRHKPSCAYHSRVNTDGGAKTYSSSAVREEEDGTLRIGLDFSLRVSAADSERATPAAVHLPRERRQVNYLGKMKMLGLLHLLWENTGLNEWAPWLEGKRSLTTVMNRLQKESSSIKQGYTILGDVLLLQENGYGNKKAVSYACANSRRLVVISELNEWSSALITSNNLPLAGTTKSSPPAGMPYLTIDSSRWENTLARFPRDVAWWQRGGKIIAIAVTDEPEERKSAKSNRVYFSACVRQVVLMMVSERWIPLNSSYEGITEEKLAKERRQFTKPLIYDSAEDQYHPDFILTDVNGADFVPLEVWGRDTEDYLQHRAVKEEWYQQKFGDAWWSWDAVSDPRGEEIPTFPPRKEYYEFRYPIEKES
ncbi:DUF1173 family protein [Pectobacterium brasiliense]|uniref:DUF1173 family protein n=1 Tax=Pectobacterium brasiliense TaxID=180957 RepID=UPI00196A0F16|nr:DUF1173 family protein [Pectobacterium brasiliense]MBN3344957.1 DUF1173 family protein [Pectobacterium brasiliense]